MTERPPVELSCIYCSPDPPPEDFTCPYCNNTGVLIREWYYGLEGKICTLNKEVYLPGKGPDPDWPPGPRLKLGTQVKVVMCSRFGDVGITTDLDADHGYSNRVDPETLTPLEE